MVKSFQLFEFLAQKIKQNGRRSVEKAKKTAYKHTERRAKNMWKIQVNQRSVKVYTNVQTCASSEVESGWWLLSNNKNRTPSNSNGSKKSAIY